MRAACLPLMQRDPAAASSRLPDRYWEDPSRRIWRNAECYNAEVIRRCRLRCITRAGLAILRGNVCPNGAVIKPTAASPRTAATSGKAYVFENHEQMEQQIDLDYLPIDRNTILVMKNGGPKGAPGFPEWGWLPMPKMLLKQGMNDIVRISDARMSGTSFGTVVLHVAPESAIGGPLGIVQTGDEVVLDVAARTLNVSLTDDEIAKRSSAL